MNKVLIAGMAIGAALMAVPANAADLPVKAAPPPVMAPIYDWTGFYIGLNGGGGWSHVRWNFSNGNTASHDGDGGVFGAHMGYNWQSGQFVFGAEGDIDWANIRGNTLCPSVTFTCGHKAEWLASLRARAGVSFWNNAALLYATAGVGWSHFRYDEYLTATGLSPLGQPHASNDRTAWVAGLGMEYLFAPAWSMRAEWLYYGFSSHTFSPAELDGVVSTSVRPHINVVRVGISYKFGGNPVIASY